MTHNFPPEIIFYFILMELKGYKILLNIQGKSNIVILISIWSINLLF